MRLRFMLARRVPDAPSGIVTEVDRDAGGRKTTLDAGVLP